MERTINNNFGNNEMTRTTICSSSTINFNSVALIPLKIYAAEHSEPLDNTTVLILAWKDSKLLTSYLEFKKLLKQETEGVGIGERIKLIDNTYILALQHPHRHASMGNEINKPTNDSFIL